MKRYIAGMKSGNIMQFGSLGWKWEDLLKEKSVALFHKTPEEAIAAYIAMFPELSEPDIVWEMTPKEIQYKIECKKTVTYKDL